MISLIQKARGIKQEEKEKKRGEEGTIKLDMKGYTQIEGQSMQESDK